MLNKPVYLPGREPSVDKTEPGIQAADCQHDNACGNTVFADDQNPIPGPYTHVPKLVCQTRRQLGERFIINADQAIAQCDRLGTARSPGVRDLMNTTQLPGFRSPAHKRPPLFNFCTGCEAMVEQIRISRQY